MFMLVVIPVLRSDLCFACIFGKTRWSGLLYCSWQGNSSSLHSDQVRSGVSLLRKQCCHVTRTRTGLSSDGRTSLSFQGTRCNFRGFYVFIYKVYLLLSRSLTRRSEKPRLSMLQRHLYIYYCCDRREDVMAFATVLLFCSISHAAHIPHDHQQHGYNNNNISYVWYNFIVRACLIIIQFRK